MTNYVTHVTYKPLLAEIRGDGRGWDFTVICPDMSPYGLGG